MHGGMNLEVRIKAQEVKKATVNPNGSIYGFKRWAGKKVLVLLPEEEL